MNSGDEFSNALKSTAIYLYENKGQAKEKVCATIGCDKQTLESWLVNREVILEDVKAELTGHFLSQYASN